MKAFLFSFSVVFSALVSTQAALALSATPVAHQKAYYGEDFYKNVYGQAENEEMKLALKKVLKSGHVPSDNGFDQILDKCGNQKDCYTHTAYGYDRARKFIFGKFYLIPLDASSYGIKEMYCDRVYQKEDFKTGNQPGPGVIPDNTVINVEHTWPQSKFSGRYSKELQKSDLHHLFPTDSAMNSLRGNTLFGEVTHDKGKTKCDASRYGSGTAGATLIYEPPADHKGPVARALFYFSIRYDLPIKPEEEAVMKKWNREHPVNAEEVARNDEISKIQGDRNPFVDHPEIAEQIADF